MIELDLESLLVHVAGGDRLADVEAALSKDGLTLDLSTIPDLTVAAWLESGAQGARSAWLDPADHLVAGFTANARDHTASFTIRPAPRRAVGPDLLVLVLGVKGLLKLESVWLRVHRTNVVRPLARFESSDEPLHEDEAALYDAIKTALFR
jgi:alkyldihydroxyacetonephosphate synthase